jgi:hypothetical protein
VALRAIKDTFVFESVGGVRVRRKVREGQLVSPLYEADESDVEEVPDAGSTFQIAANPQTPAKKATGRRGRKKRAELEGGDLEQESD